VAHRVGAVFAPAHSGACEAAGDDAFAGGLHAARADWPAVFHVGRVVTYWKGLVKAVETSNALN